MQTALTQKGQAALWVINENGEPGLVDRVLALHAGTRADTRVTNGSTSMSKPITT